METLETRLTGTGAWDPSEYLGDCFWMPFKEPSVLRWTSTFNENDLPDLKREDPDKVLQLARLWDVNGLLTLNPNLVGQDQVPSCLRVFNCRKSVSVDRQIGDRRGQNQLEAYLPGPSRNLPNGWSLGVLELDPTRQRLSICISDRKDYYHQIKVTDERARTNALWPPLSLSSLSSTKAYQSLVDSLSQKSRRSSRPREVKGDGLAGIDKSAGRHVDPGGLVHACFASVIQGDHLGVEIATQGHRGLLIDFGLLPSFEEIVSTQPFRGSGVIQGLVIDDFFSISVEDVSPRDDPVYEPQAKQRFDRAQTAYSASGLVGSTEKDVVDARAAKVVGAELDSSDFTRGLGLTTLSAPVKKRLGLAHLSLELAQLSFSTDALQACLTGGWVSCLMYRRPLMSIMDHLFAECDLQGVDQNKPKIIRLSRKSAQELTLLSVLCPLMSADLASPLSDRIHATDASDRKGAFVSADVPIDVSRALYRTSKKKGGYHRMMTREEALRSKIDPDWEPEEEGGGNPCSHAAPCVSPSKPLAMRYHFVEVCGGAGKVATAVASHGWNVGPVIDLERSSFFDLSMLEVLMWIYFMVEQGRLDAYLVAPPCTTFSPAAYPALRSYSQPRGFNPLHPRTHLGTTLALRALSLLFLSHRTFVIGLLEQPRRSKMAWMEEWVRMLDYFGASETWLASCNFASPHQKEFRILGVNAPVQKLHFPCTRDHDHVPIQGKYTKPSATYTDELAATFGHFLSDCLTSKLRKASAHEIKTGGLESVLANDVAITADWKEGSSWFWKGRPHINVLEVSAFGRLCYYLASTSPRQRFVAGLDSNVALCALLKGRSPSYGLRPSLRRICVTLVAGCLYPALHFFPTRINPADHPTRDREIPSVSQRSLCKDFGFSDLFDLAKSSDLRRCSSNWCRLVLLVLARPLPWWGSNDSWRFSHYHFSAYPLTWSCSQFASLHADHGVIGFDSTLGFPGEGPGFGVCFALFLACGFRVGSVRLSVFDCCARCYWPPRCLLLCLFISDLGAPVAVAAPVWSHGNLDPRSREDVKRAQGRQGVLLDEGRPVLEKTKEGRKKMLAAFSEWLVSTGITFEDLMDPQHFDIEFLNLALEKYGRALYTAGRPYGHYAETINAVSAQRPAVRRMLQGAWDLAYTWLREEPPTHHLAMPWQVLLSLLVTASLWGWYRVAGTLAISWGGLTRIGEVLAAERRHLILPADVGWTDRFILLQIQEPKTRFKAARHQVARVDQPQLVAFIGLVFGRLHQDQKLWPMSPQTLRLRFQKLLGALKLDKIPKNISKGFDLGSLRAGGASWLLLTSEDSELVRRRGRWINHKVMEIYIQEAASIQFLPNLDSNIRSLVLQGAELFPIVLEKLTSYHNSLIPENAWKLLLFSNDAKSAERYGWKRWDSQQKGPGQAYLPVQHRQKTGEKRHFLGLKACPSLTLLFSHPGHLKPVGILSRKALVKPICLCNIDRKLERKGAELEMLINLSRKGLRRVPERMLGVFTVLPASCCVALLCAPVCIGRITLLFVDGFVIFNFSSFEQLLFHLNSFQLTSVVLSCCSPSHFIESIFSVLSRVCRSRPGGQKKEERYFMRFQYFKTRLNRSCKRLFYQCIVTYNLYMYAVYSLQD